MNNVPMTLPELALAIHDTPFFHGSSFVQLGDGRILHVCAQWVNYSEDGGLTWSEMEEQGDPIRNNMGNNSLVKLDGRNAVGLAGRVPWEPPQSTWASPSDCQGFWFWRSEDGGETWEPPVRMTPPDTCTAGYQDTFLRTSSGRIVLPVYTHMGRRRGVGDRRPPACGKLVKNQWVCTNAHFHDPNFTAVRVLYSDDEGRTWQCNADGDLMILLDWSCKYSYVNESTVTEVAPGRLLMMMRNGLGRLFQAWSEDNGESWTRPQPTSLASSTAPAQIRTLPNGHLLCVWNQESEEDIKRGYNRTRVSAAISRNGGSVWEFFQNVQSLHETTRVEPGPIRPVRPAEIHFEPGQPAPERAPEHCQSVEEHGRWSYPSCLVLEDRVLITHTFTQYPEHPEEARLFMTGRQWGQTNQKLKVLPLKWFYGGKEPADNPFLKTAYEPARP
jgi:hypothetical protein